MTMAVVTVIIKCTSDYPKHEDLDLLHDMAY